MVWLNSWITVFILLFITAGRQFYCVNKMKLHGSIKAFISHLIPPEFVQDPITIHQVIRQLTDSGESGILQISIKCGR